MTDVQNAWHDWGIQALVLVSFTLQVMLLILAEFLRSVDSGALRFLAWSAYILADSTAIYVLGHMSVISRSAEHGLAAFWAPFLLLHLGGQDNITAYAIEDNSLWLRHLQTFVVQVAAAAYVLYSSSIVPAAAGSHHSFLQWAAVLMFLVGAVKYGERVWSLRCSNSTSNATGKNYRQMEKSHRQGGPSNDLRYSFVTASWDTEDCLLMAHQMLGIPKELFKGILYQVNHHEATEVLKQGRLYKVAEMQLSLMHDVFYTKAEVMHSSYGLCLHMLSPVFTTVALLLFVLLHRHHHGPLDGYGRVDVAVTYVLLVGALVLEVVSAWRSIFSSWACVLLLKYYSSCQSARRVDWPNAKESARMVADREPSNKSSFFHRYPPKRTLSIWWRIIYYASIGSVGRAVLYLRRRVRAADWGSYWSGSVGQHNLLQLAIRCRSSKRSKLARWMGKEDAWNTWAYSTSVPVSAFIQELLVEHVVSKGPDLDNRKNRNVMISSHFDSRGQEVLRNWGLFEGLAWSMEEKILVWHIATNIYMSRMERPQPERPHRLDEAAEVLSNYMVFLLSSRPYMLGPTASRDSYLAVCYGLIRQQLSSAEDLAKFLQSYGEEERDGRWRLLKFDHTTQKHLVSILDKGCELGAKLVSNEVQGDAAATPDLITQVWVETLCYASQECSARSHAKQLSNGGELITVAAILVEYFKQAKIDNRPPSNGRRGHEFIRREIFEKVDIYVSQ